MTNSLPDVSTEDRLGVFSIGDPSQPPDPHADCKVFARILDRIGDKWTIMTVGVLSGGPMRFNAILKEVGGVSHRMMTLTLRGLERDGLVTRTAYPTIPPRVEYELTPRGRSLIKPLQALATWAGVNRSGIEADRERYDRDDLNVRSGRSIVGDRVGEARAGACP